MGKLHDILIMWSTLYIIELIVYTYREHKGNVLQQDFHTGSGNEVIVSYLNENPAVCQPFLDYNWVVANQHQGNASMRAHSMLLAALIENKKQCLNCFMHTLSEQAVTIRCLAAAS